jgi:hypothetical protein
VADFAPHAMGIVTHRVQRRPKAAAFEKGTRTMSLYQVRHVSISIDRPPDVVYTFLSQPENLPKWATGLGSIKQVGGGWIADVPAVGEVKLSFVEKNAFGVADHDVLLPSGERVHNPIRAIPNGSGTEVVFTVIRLPETSDEKFAADVAWVDKDLHILRDRLER